jgi:pimeloyl-ACP methyl ester carboxylesterase
MLIMGAPPIGPGVENVEKAFLPSSLEATGKADLSDKELNEFVDAIYGTLKSIPKALRLTAKRTDGQAREIMISHWMSGGPGHKQTHTVNTWTNPIAVIHGKKDPFVALDYLNQMQWENLWDEKIYVVDSVGHAPFIESPDEFNEILGRFIQKTLSV